MRSRHQGTFDPEHPAPFELSRGKIEDVLKCPACFWLEKARGVKRRQIPFNLNSLTDELLKRDFDQYRGKGPHPLMVDKELGHLQPFDHEDVAKWRDALHFGSSQRHLNTLHAPTQILFGGGLDDVWENTVTGELHIIEYKSTGSTTNKPREFSVQKLNASWYQGYKKQVEMYQWLLRRKEFQVSDIAYFVYVDGTAIDRHGMINKGNLRESWMKFNNFLFSYEGDDSWVEDALFLAKKVVQQPDCPEHSDSCEHKDFYVNYGRAMGFPA